MTIAPRSSRASPPQAQVRERAEAALCSVEHALGPQALFEGIAAATKSRNWRVREHWALLLVNLLREAGPAAAPYRETLPSATSLLTDPNAHVRDAASALLAELSTFKGTDAVVVRRADWDSLNRGRRLLPASLPPQTHPTRPRSHLSATSAP